MVGHKLGEFAPTRTFYGHGKDAKKGKKYLIFNIKELIDIHCKGEDFEWQL